MVRFGARIEMARSVEDVLARRCRLLFLDAAQASALAYEVGALLRATLAPALVHTAKVAPDIAYSIDDIDRAMMWGFGWELGPMPLEAAGFSAEGEADAL